MRILFFVFIFLFFNACSFSKLEEKNNKIEKKTQEKKQIEEKKIIKKEKKVKIIDCKSLKDYSNRISCYKNKSSKGDIEATNSLAMIFFEEENYNESKIYLEKLAKLDNLQALKKLGLIYHNGLDVKQDYKKAFEFFSRYLEVEYDKSIQREVAYYYKKGVGVKQDYKKAFNLYMLSANDGDVFSMSELGYLFAKGYGVEKDYEQAYKWFLKAANLESSYSKSWLGFLYEKGLGVQKDLKKAKSWYEQANTKYSKKRLEILNTKG